jgi:hypothetical protein
MNWLLKFFVLSNVMALVSCSSLTNDPILADYSKAMDLVRSSITNDGIPRKKVIAYFKLAGTTSSRGLCGGRGGFSSTNEHWSLANGYMLEAYKHTYYGDDLPFKSSKGTAIIEKPIQEPKPEIYFDTLYLADHKRKYLLEISLPYKR